MALSKIKQTDGTWLPMEGVEHTVRDTLTSTSTTDALSARQGKVLNEKIDLQDGRLGNVIGMQGWNQLADAVSGSNTITDTKNFFDLYWRQYSSPYTFLVNEQIYSATTVSTIVTSTFTGATSIWHNGSQSNVPVCNGMINVTQGHKYYFNINVTGANPLTVGGLSWQNLQVIDLTALFGEGNEPTTVEEFRKLFPADYYPYCQGTMDLLWTNASPTSAFVVQTVSLDLSNYRAVMIIVKGSVTRDDYNVCWGFKQNSKSCYISGSATEPNAGYRPISRYISWIGDSGIAFDVGMLNYVINNNYCLPYQIYGIR